MILSKQISLFEQPAEQVSVKDFSQPSSKKFPKTRYQGSKYKLLPWLKENLERVDFATVLDAFGGTGSVSFLFKQMGKTVYYNDILQFNFLTGKALIENNIETLNTNDISLLVSKDDNFSYLNFIESTFADIYYTNEENQWLDIVLQNISKLKNEYKQALAFWALFQSCIIKRPYNLFHRKNLYVRTSDVKRSFGNKKTWDTPFEQHFFKFIKEANQAIFDNKKLNKAYNQDAQQLNLSPDLVYIDPPYIPAKGTLTFYRDFYHFLEGMTDYHNWPKYIDFESKHKKLFSISSLWENKENITFALKELLEKYKDSILAISYRIDGIPSIKEIKKALSYLNKKVTVQEIDYKYVLSTKSDSKEVLIIAE